MIIKSRRFERLLFPRSNLFLEISPQETLLTLRRSVKNPPTSSTTESRNFQKQFNFDQSTLFLFFSRPKKFPNFKIRNRINCNSSRFRLYFPDYFQKYSRQSRSRVELSLLNADANDKRTEGIVVVKRSTTDSILYSGVGVVGSRTSGSERARERKREREGGGE